MLEFDIFQEGGGHYMSHPIKVKKKRGRPG